MDSPFKIVTETRLDSSKNTLQFIVGSNQTGDWKKTLSKRRHDLDEALRTLSIGIDMIKGGYRFDDAGASQKVQFLERSLALLKMEIEIVSQMYAASLK